MEVSSYDPAVDAEEEAVCYSPGQKVDWKREGRGDRVKPRAQVGQRLAAPSVGEKSPDPRFDFGMTEVCHKIFERKGVVEVKDPVLLGQFFG